VPFYEYRCEKCEHQFDELQKLNDPLLTDCPECGEAALKKLVSAPSFRLKGSGWYETDFKKDKQRNLADGGDGKAASSSDKPAAGGDKKAAAEKPAKKTPPAAKPAAD